MPENRAKNRRLVASALVTLLLIIATVSVVAAQTPTPEDSASATPTATPIVPTLLEVKELTPAWEELPPGVAPPPLEHPPADGQNTCYDCHLQLGDKHTDISQAWQESVHGGADIGCAECHGGDPRTDEMKLAMQADAGYIGIPDREVVPQICGGCHSDVDRMRAFNLPTDQYTKYLQSVHGTKLQDGDLKVAICTDCHGVHDIKSGSDSRSPIYPLNVPDLCAGCHSDAELMEPYDIRTDQYAQYEESVHGQMLLEDQDLRAPNCASCHGSHGAQPPDDEEVIDVCGKCHTATEELYQESLHSRLGHNAPKCWTCHGTHDVVKTDESLFFHPEPPEDQNCGTCHVNSEEFRMDKVRFEAEEDRRCDTCHHQESRIMVQIEGIHGALTEADEAYQQAEEAIQEAGSLGMIVTEAELKLAETRTSLIRGRAAVHTTKLPAVIEHTDQALVSADEAQNIADEKLAENLFRRQSMVIAVVVILAIVVTLYLLKFDLYRRLKPVGPDTKVPTAPPDLEADRPTKTEEADGN